MGTDAQHTPFDAAVAAVRRGADVRQEAAGLFDQLTPDERLGLLDGDWEFWDGFLAMLTGGYNTVPIPHGAVPRLGIPGTQFVDGPRGCVSGNGTAFPVSMARGATWDPELEERVGAVIGREVRAVGGNFFGGVCINLLRHPAWGRAQETYGDDPFHLGEMGAALVRGTQRYVMACAKHYALNSMENARFTVDVTIDEATLQDVYLPHFKRTVDEGVAAIMSAYNSVNGEWAGQNRHLLTEVLRDQWGWDGITVSDFIWGLRDAGASLEAGLDLEEPFRQQRAQALTAESVDGELVERSGVRMIAAMLRSYAAREDGPFGPELMADDDARALAREVAARAMVLLRNEPVDGAPVLPLDPAAVTSIAVIGRLATEVNQGDHGSSDVRPPSSTTPLEGITAAFPGARVVHVADDDPVAAAEAARQADVAVVVTGFTAEDEGEYVGSDTMNDPDLLALYPPRPDGVRATGDEVVMTAGEGFGGDRDSLRLRPEHEEVIRATAAANPRTVVSVVAAGPVLTEAWRHEVPAVLLQWYAGMEGGRALGDVLTGAAEPAGRLPFSVPTSEEHLPAFDRDATAITYDRWHGQRLLDRLGVEAAYPHGFGLSYTTFTIGDVTADGSAVTATVTNTGGRDGRHVVQVYGRTGTGGYPGERMLVGFRSVAVPAGGSVQVTVPVSLLALARWDDDRRERVLPEVADVALQVGAHATDPHAITLHLG
ncbi:MULTISPECIES: beta-glucosidase family protein [unclassified Modestobacter]|uniref:beta-glucosidase family protein n=1 Tax=unclassified Modestobacter TaxID=2643866 RepID=UPI0022AA4D39|nr:MULTISPECIES: glycoside hydrolase family 3 C-terminal domain-containing protein [unclassified Modestobacter]MCZ2827078.1 glycoside hydrolase family 3 C-terminal domain-containing protein [Modestobacter sp. VKM Ac-2981]MCZ2854329.1 glycoside hydrolase family 3 C-terminal domain-containing protein [Modestobacter sp. VKM Ac-2982]